MVKAIYPLSVEGGKSGKNLPPSCGRGMPEGQGVGRRRKCTCQQKLDTKLKKLGIKIEYLYKIQ